MNSIKLKLSAILLMLPSLVFASGGEGLLTFYMLFGSVAIFILFVILVKLSRIRKLLLSWAYIGTLLLMMNLTQHWPYAKNETIINLCLGAVPIMVALFVFVILRARPERSKSSN